MYLFSYLLSTSAPPKLYQTDLAPSNFTIMASAPVTNCGEGKESLTFTVAGSIEIGETWTTGTQLGISVGQINLGTSVEFSRTQTIKYSQEVKIPVEPGQKVYSTAVDLLSSRLIARTRPL